MTREVKCKDGWRSSTRLIFRVSPHQPECATSNSFHCFVTTTESDSIWCSVLFFFFVCVCVYCAVCTTTHKLRPTGSEPPPPPPSHTLCSKAPITEPTVYFSFQQSTLFISVFTALMGGAAVSPRAPSGRCEEDRKESFSSETAFL